MVTLERWLNTRHWLVLSAALLLLALVRGGFALEIAAQEADPSFPLPQPGLAALSFGLPALVWIFGIEGQTPVIGLLGVVLTLIAYVLAMGLLQRSFSGPARPMALVAFALGPTVLVLLGNIGRHDVLVIAGAVILGLRGERLEWAIGGTAIMLLGNPEQALVGLAAASLLSLASRFRSYLQPILVCTGIALITLAALALWARSLGVMGRADWFAYHLPVSLLTFWGNFGHVLYAAYGILWVVAVAVIVRARGWDRLFSLAGLVVVPIGAMMVTADQTRVFVGVSTIAIMMALKSEAPSLANAVTRLTPTPVAWTLLFAVLLPAIEVAGGTRGSVRIPFIWVYDYVVAAGWISRLGQGPW